MISHGETTTVEFKVAPPRPAELAEQSMQDDKNAQTLHISLESRTIYLDSDY